MLLDKTAIIIGAGGLGGYVVEYLARLNIAKLVIMDGDVFDESNLDRQLYSAYENLGKFKAQAAAERIKKISRTDAFAVNEFFPNDIIDGINADIIVDCLDNVKDRLLLEEYAANRGIPLVHGAINGAFGQVTTIMPGDYTLKYIYKDREISVSKTMSYVPALVAALEASEALKTLTGPLLGANC